MNSTTLPVDLFRPAGRRASRAYNIAIVLAAALLPAGWKILGVRR